MTEATPEGLLAVGGDLSPERLLAAYARGIFPWYSGDMPVLWWSPDPRCILPLNAVHIPRRLERMLRRGMFTFTWDRAFPDVIAACAATPRPGQSGTWLVEAMMHAYVALHRLGYAHSLEVWKDGALAGGLYGVALGQAFFGESMFHRISDASKAGVVWLTRRLREEGCQLLDCQQYTAHMARFGAVEIPRRDFLRLLQQALGVKGLHAPSRCRP